MFPQPCDTGRAAPWQPLIPDILNELILQTGPYDSDFAAASSSRKAESSYVLHMEDLFCLNFMGMMICVKSELWQRAFSQEVGPGQVCSDYFYPSSMSYLMSEEIILAPKVGKGIFSSSSEKQFRNFFSIFSVNKMHIWLEFRNPQLLQMRLLKNWVLRWGQGVA